MNDWDKWCLELAEHVSKKSKDPSTQVGAVISGPNREIISCGFNGFPRRIKDTPERLNDRMVKYSKILHGEHNCILFAGHRLANSTLYTFPFLPCKLCSLVIVQTGLYCPPGIVRVVAPFTDNHRWMDSISEAKENFDEAGIIYEEVR